MLRQRKNTGVLEETKRARGKEMSHSVSGHDYKVLCHPCRTHTHTHRESIWENSLELEDTHRHTASHSETQTRYQPHAQAAISVPPCAQCTLTHLCLSLHRLSLKKKKSNKDAASLQCMWLGWRTWGQPLQLWISATSPSSSSLKNTI